MCGILVFTIAAVFLCNLGHADDENAQLSTANAAIHSGASPVIGVVHGTDGKTLGGAYVTVRRLDDTMAVTGFTGADGRFEIPWEGGKYVLIIGTPGYEMKTLSGLGDRQEVVLHPSADLKPYMSSADWLTARLPQDERSREFLLTCGHCHELGNGMQSFGKGHTTEEWEHIMKFMRSGPGGGAGGLSAYAVQPWFDIPKAAKWLVANGYGPDAKEPQFQTPAQIRGESSRAVITEWFVPDKEAYIHDMLISPDGKTGYAPDYYHDNIWILNVPEGKWKKVPLPVAKHPAGMHSLAFDSQGNVWITVQLLDELAKFNPQDQTFVFYQVPTPKAMPHTPVFDSKGHLWVTEDGTNKVAMLDVATAKFKEYELPLTGEMAPEWVLAYGIDIDSKDRVWYAKLYENTFGMIDPDTGKITQYSMKDYAPEKYTSPRRLKVGPDDTVWIPEYSSNKISRFDPATKTMKRYALPIPNSCVYAFYVDRKRNIVWAAGNMSNALFRFDPTTEKFETFYLPRGRVSHTRSIDQDITGDIWTSSANDPAIHPAVVRLHISAQ